jgi:3-methyladenine DNA glycosylase/8-oxoguanine DNA glycosylase
MDCIVRATTKGEERWTKMTLNELIEALTKLRGYVGGKVIKEL